MAQDSLRPTIPRRIRRQREAPKHTRSGPERTTSGEFVVWHTTQEHPFDKKERNRKARKQAKKTKRQQR